MKKKALNNQQEQADADTVHFKAYRLTNMCISTVYRWLIKLGLKYEPRQKGYYADGQRQQYTDKVLLITFLYELRAFWWTQIMQEEAMS
jgi:hypothetical protein